MDSNNNMRYEVLLQKIEMLNMENQRVVKILGERDAEIDKLNLLNANYIIDEKRHEEEIERFNIRLNGFEDSKNLIAKDREALLKKIEFMQNDVEYYKSGKNFSEEEQQMRDQLQIQSETINELTVALNQNEEELRAAEKVGDFFTSEMKKNLELVKTLQKTIEKQNIAIEHSELRIHELEIQHDKVKIYENDINELREGNSSLCNTLENWTGKVGDMGLIIEKNEEQIWEKERYIKQVKNELKDCHRKLDSLNTKNITLENENDFISNDLAQYKKDNVKKKNEINQIEDKVKKLQKECNELRERQSSSVVQLETVNEINQNLNHQLKSLVPELQDKVHTFDLVEQEHLQEIGHKVNTIEELREKILALEVNLYAQDEFKTKYNTLEQDYRVSMTDIEKIADELKRKTEQVSELNVE